MAVPLIPFALLGELPGELWLEHPSAWVVFLLGVVLLGSDFVLPIPASIVAVFLGAQLGIGLGFVAIAMGLCLSTTLAFLLGWYLGYPFVARFVSSRQLQSLRAMDNQFSYLALAMMRSVPVFSEASVLAAGAARLNRFSALVTIAIANLGLALLYAGFGAYSQALSSPLLLFVGGIGVPTVSISALLLLNPSVLVRNR